MQQYLYDVILERYTEKRVKQSALDVYNLNLTDVILVMPRQGMQFR